MQNNNSEVSCQKINKWMRVKHIWENNVWLKKKVFSEDAQQTHRTSMIYFFFDYAAMYRKNKHNLLSIYYRQS